MLTIAAIGAVGFIGYFVLKSGVGVDEFTKSAGRYLKQGTEAIDATGEYLSKESQRLTGWIHGVEEGRKGVIEGIGNTGCHIQRGFGILLSPFGVKPLECKGAGSWVSKKDSRIIALHNLTASPKPYPKMTNNLYYMLKNIGADV